MLVGHVELELHPLEQELLIASSFIHVIGEVLNHVVDLGLEHVHVALEQGDVSIGPLLIELLSGIVSICESESDGILLNQELDLVAILLEVLPLEMAVHDAVAGFLDELVLVHLLDGLDEGEDAALADPGDHILELGLPVWHLCLQGLVEA